MRISSFVRHSVKMRSLWISILAVMICFTISATTRSAIITVNHYDPGQGQITTYYSPNPSTPEIHILGEYEARSDTKPGSVTVNVVPPTGHAMVPIVLVLSSYVSETWHIEAPKGAAISEIVLSGLEAQSITMNTYNVVPVINVSPNGIYAYAWPSATGGSNTPGLVSYVQNLVGQPLTSFTGTYLATEFTIVGTAVPEPSTMLVAAIGGIALLAYRRRSAASPAACVVR